MTVIANTASEKMGPATVERLWFLSIGISLLVESEVRAERAESGFVVIEYCAVPGVNVDHS
jgi:hypothetical protein